MTALAAVGLWSTNAWAADIALGAMDVGWLLLVKFAVASVALLIVRNIHGRRHPHRPGAGNEHRQQPVRPLGGRTSLSNLGVVIGVVGLTGTLFLQYLAFALAPIVAANVLAYAWPLLAAVWLAMTLRTRHALVLASFALLGFAGAALIFTGPGEPVPADAAPTAMWGYLAAIGSAGCMAFYTLATNRLSIRTVDLLIPATVTGALAAAVLTVATSDSWPEQVGWLAAAYVGLGPTAAGYALWTRAMSGGGAERLAPLGYATPLLSTLLLLITGAPATATTLLGVAFILAASIGVLATPKRQEKPSG